MTTKQDITHYSDQELSLLVLNTEHLYRQFLRCEDEDDLRVLCEEFEYTGEQFEELMRDLAEEIV